MRCNCCGYPVDGITKTVMVKGEGGIIYPQQVEVKPPRAASWLLKVEGKRTKETNTLVCDECYESLERLYPNPGLETAVKDAIRELHVRYGADKRPGVWFKDPDKGVK